MEFQNYTTLWDCAKHSLPKHLLGKNSEQFYEMLISDAYRSNDERKLFQAINELDWERLKRPYYNVYPGIIPILTRLNLALDSELIRLPKSSLCVRFPKDYVDLDVDDMAEELWKTETKVINTFINNPSLEGKKREKEPDNSTAETPLSE
jgi:hypothetical protein